MLKLNTLGIKNAGVLLTLKEVADRTSLKDKALDTYFLFAMIFQDNNLPSWIALIVMLVVPIVCFILALIELIGALKRRKSFSESGINEDSGFFSYLFQIAARCGYPDYVHFSKNSRSIRVFLRELTAGTEGGSYSLYIK